ncbi:ATP-binding protein [Paraburkholderia haematera]|uniref:histidine kinase n=1 Tax=Paraburkholderia haematera TaxID=2793077 RepID=A0ABM8QDF5_9BURK|nr:transporter substrate-binding domain-containing protein [Paraburkholderia haematera]CAE6690988.1 Sensor histidine kinase RcsC [Paraburkholderia haematera]
MKLPRCIAMRQVLRRVSQSLLAAFVFVAMQMQPAVAQPVAGQSHPSVGGAFPATLTVGVLASGWLPFDGIQDGQLTGLSADYLRALVGPNVVIESKAFPDLPQLLAAACAGNVDLVTSLARTLERERCFSFTAPYFRASASVAVRRDGDVYANAAQLAGARLAVEKGFALERSLRERFPRAQLETFASTHAALQAVAQGDADAYLGFTPSIQYALNTEEFRGLQVAFEERSKLASLRFAVPRNRVALRDQLDRALASMNPVDDTAIRARWLSGNFDAQAASTARHLVLTPQEQAWLRSLPPLQVGFDSGWPPFSYVDESGRPAGIAAEYLDYLSRALGVVFKRAQTADWPATMEAFQRGDLAILATSSSSDPRLKSAVHTHAYESYPLVIVGREDEPAARALNDFASRRIVVPLHVAGSIPLAADNIPASNIAVVPSLDEALKMVENGQADALVGNVAAVDILLKQRYAGVLKILGTVGGSDALGFAVRPDLSPLAGLIDRALLAMPPAEKQRIREKWVTGGAGESGTWSVPAVRLLPLLIGIGLILLVTLRAYVLLQREVRLRKQTERELALQLNFQETMMEMVPYPLVAKDLNGRYIAINRAYEEACGLRREAVIGCTAVDIQAWGEANSHVLDDLTRKMLTGGEPAQAELQFERGTGDLRHGLFWTRICRNSDGKPSCVLGTMVDITDIRRAEMLARETERRLFDVTRSLPAVVFQLRRTAGGEYSFPYIGGDTHHLLGDDRTSSMGREKIDFSQVCEEDRPFVLAELERSARCATPVNMEFRFEVEHELRWARAELVPRREKDGGVVWSGYWVDATVEHARSEELARARDVAEAASLAKDEFVAMMSHEIRTPMNGVLGLVEVLERTPLNADQGEMLSMIHESAGALLQILDDLLDYSKIEAGRLTIEAEPIDMRELVDNAVGLLAGRAHEKALKVRVDIAPDVAATLRGDSVRLRQILFNLLGNAIKFTPEGEVDVQVVVVNQTGNAQTLEMSVEDTGIGISPEVQARLFEPFVQAETSTTRRFGGTGLGLTICRKLIDLMSGTLDLRSEPGVGTRMTVRLTMPVESQRYSVSGLRGKRGVVATGDARVARALMHFGEALGLELHRVSPHAAELGDPTALAGVDMIFVSEDVELPAGAGPDSRIICLTEKPKPTGYRIIENKVRVSINPISWRGLGAACAAAMTGLPSVAPRSGGMPRQAEGATVPPDRERAIANGRLILVAEDHPVNQELIRHQLALLGFACDVTNDGVEALAALEQTSYGCLITDCHMPNLSGYELARRIREQEHGGARHLPILGITANTAPEDLTLCREAGMDDCLVKPTRLATLRDYLSRWFGSDSAWQAAPAEAVGVLPVSGPSTHSGPEPFVPVNLGHMTELWGSESTVKALLDSFVSSVREDMQALPPLLERIEVERLREWHHRVAGAASVLRYPPLLSALEDYHRDLAGKTPERLRSDGLALVRKCNAMLDGIEEQAALLA